MKNSVFFFSGIDSSSTPVSPEMKYVVDLTRSFSVPDPEESKSFFNFSFN